MAPEEDLCLAVAGTTSSGKSTLLNLLSGRFLLTPEVQESPRVRVELRHRPDRKDVTIHDPLEPQAPPVHVHSDAQARQHLRRLIARIDGLPDEGRRQAAPLGVDLPILVGPLAANSASWWQRFAGLVTRWRKPAPRLPAGRRLLLRDLPGFLSAGHEELRQTIQSGLDGALVLFVVNPLEVNEHKEDELLRLVFAEMRRQGRPWQHIFFVLNRVDVYGRDTEHQQEKERRIAGLRGRVVGLAQEVYELPERLHPPLIHQLATLPALAGELLAGSGDELELRDREYLLEVAVEYAGRMLPPNVAERLPWSWRRWRRRHLRAFCRHAASASHWRDFRKALCRHVHQAAPPLLPTSSVTTHGWSNGAATGPAVWSFERPCQGVPQGRQLRLEILVPALLHWSADGWKTIHDTPSRDTGLGTYLIDVPTDRLPAGRQIDFTFFWTEAGHWEGRDFAVAVTRQ